MTLTDLFYDHARRIAEITYWHALGWISDKERIWFEAYETETTDALYDQVVKEAPNSADCHHMYPYVGDDCEDAQLQDIMK